MNALSRWTKYILLSLVLLLSIAANSATAAPPPAMKYIKDSYKVVVSLLDKSIEERDAALRAMIKASVDLNDFARRSLGKHWAELNADQQTQYAAAFHELFEITYTRRLSDRKPDTDYELEWEDESVEDGLSKVVVIVLYEDTETEVEFALKAQADNWMIQDVSYDSVSVAEKYQDKHGKVFREKGFDGLMKYMAEQIEEQKAKKK
jgi:ABC-type transporter MlaC component